MAAEFRILEIRRGEVYDAQPLDGATPQSLKIRRPTKYVENEIVVVEPASSDSDSRSHFKVLASRIDPSFVDGRALEIGPMGQGNEHVFAECVSFEDGEPFEQALDMFRSGYYDKAGRRWSYLRYVRGVVGMAPLSPVSLLAVRKRKNSP